MSCEFVLYYMQMLSKIQNYSLKLSTEAKRLVSLITGLSCSMDVGFFHLCIYWDYVVVTADYHEEGN